jgi:AcrR family transcriptional regulator
MQQRGEETHTHIIESAYQLFSRNGYETTSVADICESAGVSKGAFYHHFPTKQAIFLELMANWLSDLDAGFQIVRQETQNVPQAILKMAKLADQVVQLTNVKLSIILEFWTQASRDPQVWNTAIAPYRRYQKYFTTLIQEGVDEGSFRAEIEPPTAARTLVSLAVGLLMQAIFDPQTFDWSHAVYDSVKLLLKGLEK